MKSRRAALDEIKTAALRMARAELDLGAAQANYDGETRLWEAITGAPWEMDQGRIAKGARDVNKTSHRVRAPKTQDTAKRTKNGQLRQGVLTENLLAVLSRAKKPMGARDVFVALPVKTTRDSVHMGLVRLAKQGKIGKAGPGLYTRKVG